jgi:cardiolipin synthase
MLGDERGGAKMLPWSPLYALHTASYRSHRKIVVIDGRLATPAVRIWPKPISRGGKGHFTGWHDFAIHVTDQIVWALQASFAVQCATPPKNI